MRPLGETGLPVSIWILFGLCSAVEAVLSLSDLSGGQLRNAAVLSAGFRPDLLHGDAPLYPGQRVVMFLSYAFLHGGFAHYAVNMLTLVTLGSVVARRAGEGFFVLLWFAAALGGAAVYALIGPAMVPMVGASGALFGLAGALVGWEIRFARASSRSLAPAMRLVLLLVVLNAVLWWTTGGRLAWQTHLGGALVGLALAFLRPAPPARQA